MTVFFPRLNICIELSKSTGRFTAGGGKFGDYIPTFEMNSENMWGGVAKGEFK